MLRWLCFLTCFYMALAAGAACAEPVSLRSRVEARGADITMGDVFEGTPSTVADRVIAAAPAPGQVSTLPVQLLSAVASAAGLEWRPPLGLIEVRVVRPAGARATLAPSGGAPGARAGADAAVRRGEPVALVYRTPGLEMTLSGARALEDGAVGQSVRIRTASNQTIEAVVTGPGAARANP